MGFRVLLNQTWAIDFLMQEKCSTYEIENTCFKYILLHSCALNCRELFGIRPYIACFIHLQIAHLLQVYGREWSYGGALGHQAVDV